MSLPMFGHTITFFDDIILYSLFTLKSKITSCTNKVIDKARTSKKIIDLQQAEAKYQVCL